jgi:hypothetical protein
MYTIREMKAAFNSDERCTNTEHRGDLLRIYKTEGKYDVQETIKEFGRIKAALFILEAQIKKVEAEEEGLKAKPVTK